MQTFPNRYLTNEPRRNRVGNNSRLKAIRGYQRRKQLNPPEDVDSPAAPAAEENGNKIPVAEEVPVAEPTAEPYVPPADVAKPDEAGKSADAGGAAAEKPPSYSA